MQVQAARLVAWCATIAACMLVGGWRLQVLPLRAPVEGDLQPQVA